MIVRSFRHRAVNATAWSLASQAGRLVALRLTILVLARLLATALDFRRLSAVGGLTVGASSAVAVAMAYGGWGVSSLAAQLVLLSAVPALLVWVVDDWSPRGGFDRAALGRLASWT